MARFQLDRIANPHTLSAVAPELLRELLRSRWEGFFALHDASLDPPLDCCALTRALLAPRIDVPADLLDALYVVGEGADVGDTLREAAVAHPALANALSDEELTDHDVAVLAYLRAPGLIEDLLVRRRLQARKSFSVFAAVRAIEEHVPLLSGDDLRSLELDFESGFVVMHKGREVRVIAFQAGDAQRYLVWHGEPFRRVPVVAKGRSSSVFVRPETWDVVTFEPATGQLRVNARGVRVVDLYRRKLGLHLTGSEETFSSSRAVYTLAPLLEGPRALYCGDVPGLEDVALVGITWRCPNRMTGRAAFRDSEDVFGLLQAEGHALPRDPSLFQTARYRLTLDGGEERAAEVRLPNVAQVMGDEGGSVFTRFLAARGYVCSDGREGGRAGVQQTLAFA